MTFLQPWLLMALPLMTLPILIHLINQRRHKTVHWGAMQFLLSAKKMSKGMARLRHWLIMASRVIAIGALIFAIGRPLATGWLGTLAGGKPETVIVLLDRSPSMHQQILETGESKINRSLRQVVDTLKAFGGAQQIVLIESTRNKAYQVETPEDLLDFPEAVGADCSANIPAMMQSALDYVTENQTGRTDIWICSDSRQNDWRVDSGKWKDIHTAFSTLEGIRFQFLDYRQDQQENRRVVVQKVERQDFASKSELVLDLMIQRSDDRLPEETIDIGISIADARSIKKVHFRNGEKEFFVSGFRIEIDKSQPSGWGVVDLPADSNPSDNHSYFTFSKRPVLKTVIVSSDYSATKSLQLVSSISVSSKDKLSSEILRPDEVAKINWSDTVMILWHAPLPQGEIAAQVEQFISSGKVVVFFPPKNPTDSRFAGASWEAWKKDNSSGQIIGQWERNEEVLRPSSDGAELPLDDIKVFEYCSLKSDHRTLARYGDGGKFLTKAYTESGGAYFCSTLPSGRYSTLAQNGLVLFAMVQRFLTEGAVAVGPAKTTGAGTIGARAAAHLTVLSGTGDSISSAEHPFFAGVYGSEDQILAVNSSASESGTGIVSQQQLDSLFGDLDFYVISDSLGKKKTLASEIWKYFVMLVGAALLAEVVLCLPPKPVKSNSASLLNEGAGR